jgi:hypothetical protein
VCKVDCSPFSNFIIDIDSRRYNFIWTPLLLRYNSKAHPKNCWYPRAFTIPHTALVLVRCHDALVSGFCTTACPPAGSTIHVTKFCANSEFFSHTCLPSKTAAGLSKGFAGSSSFTREYRTKLPSIGERAHLEERCGGKGSDWILGVLHVPLRGRDLDGLIV